MDSEERGTRLRTGRGRIGGGGLADGTLALNAQQVGTIELRHLATGNSLQISWEDDGDISWVRVDAAALTKKGG